MENVSLVSIGGPVQRSWKREKFVKVLVNGDTSGSAHGVRHCRGWDERIVWAHFGTSVKDGFA